MEEKKKLQAIKIWIEGGRRRERVEKEGSRAVILVDDDGWSERGADGGRWRDGVEKKGKWGVILNDDEREKEREGCNCFFFII